MVNNDAKKIIKSLKDDERYLTSVSVLRNETIETTVTSYNFLSLDMPIARRMVSEEIYNLHMNKSSSEGVDATSVPITELKVRGMLE